MQYLVPHFILDKYTENEFGGQFEAVSLFVDVSGFSTITTTLMQHGNEAAEAMSDIMAALFEPLVSAVYAHGGFITTFAGDAFTALFPTDDLQNQDTYLRALAAAVIIQDYMRENPTQQTPYGNFPFSVKLGIAVGQVGWGILTPDESTAVKSAYYFNGSAVDEAARAEHYAESGNLIVTAPVYEMLTDVIQTIPAGEDGHQRILTITGNLPESQNLPDIPDIPQDHFVPAVILERKTRGEFRQVVSVFVNLMGIDTAGQLEDFVRSVFSLQQQYGGYLGRVDFGDKGCNLLLFWGMPTSHENDISRALNFLLDLPNITPSTFKSGVTYQTVFACFAGSSFRSEFTTYGGGIALAARLMVKAPWGEVWLNEPLYQRAQRYFELEKVGDYPFKGFTEPQPVYSLIEPKQQALAEFFQGEMVGREAELQQIRDFIEPIFLPADSDQSRFGGICVIAGEAGLGKSRLVHEFQQRLNEELVDKEQTVKLLFGYTNQLIQEPLSPFRYALMDEFDQVVTASEARNKKAFSRRMDEIIALIPADYGRELNRLRSFVGSVIDLYWENSLYATAHPEARQEMLFTALKLMLQGMSLIQPTIIITEDLHWVDAETRVFAERLFRNMEGFPLVMVGTVRLNELEQAFEFPDLRMTLINLAPMSEVEMEALAASILGNPISAEVLNLLMQRADGNPFFAEQILLYLQQQGEIELRNDVWFLTNITQQGSLPGDLRAIFVARLDQLTQEVKDVVQAASILGREFEVHILASMLKDEPRLNEKVLLAEQETVWSALNQVRYLFKNALLRDAAYSMQLRARRRILHQLAAETLETLYIDNLAIHYRDIAYHYEAAYLQGIPEIAHNALDYLFKAGEQALNNYQHEIAADYFSRCLEISPVLDDKHRYAILLARANAYHDIQKWELVEADLVQLAELTNKTQIPHQKAEISLKQAYLEFARTKLDSATSRAEQSVKLAQSAQAVAIEAQAHSLLADIHSTHLNVELYEYHTQQALNLARAANERDIEAQALIDMGNIAMHHRLEEETYIAYIQQALGIFRETNNRRQEAKTLYALSTTTNIFEEKYQLTQEALSIARQIGNRVLEAQGLTQLAAINDSQHNFNEAHQYYFDTLNLYREISDERGETNTLFSIGNFYRYWGELEEAGRYYQEGRTKAERLDIMTVARFNYLEIYYFEKGMFEETLDYIEKMLTKANQTNSTGMQYIALGTMVNRLTFLDKINEAQSYYQQLIKLEPSIDSTVDGIGEDIITIIRNGLLHFFISQDMQNEALISAERIRSVMLSEGWREVKQQHGISMEFYFELYRVWEANGDRRAYECLEEGYNSLQHIAQHLDTDEQRQKFFENVYYNRQIMRAYQEYKGITPPPEPIAEIDVDQPASAHFAESEIIPDEELEIIVGEVEPESAQPRQETISVTADDETPVVIHIEADTTPTIHTSIVHQEENDGAIEGQTDQPKPRPIIHVNITIENHGTIHNFNIYNGDK